MTSSENDMFYCSFVSIHYIICECGETFPSEEDLRGHLEKDHPHKKERKEYKCGACETVFRTEQECILHYEQSHIQIKEEEEEEEEGETYTEEEAYTEESYKEEAYTEEPYTEEACTEEPYTEEAYTEDTCIEGINEQRDCPLEFQSEVDVKTEKREKTRPKKPKKNYNEKNIVCEVCGKRYASNAALKYHQRVHTGERPYKCTLCPKSFTMPLFLQIHTRTHTGERPYMCPMCPKAFSNKAALLRHDRVHTGIKPYECPQCGKFFTQSNSMKLHVNTVHLKMPAPYKSKNRRNKAKEREMLREAFLKVIDNEDASAVNSIADDGIELTEVKQEVDFYEQVEESEILYEDEIDPKEITYEVVYQD